MNETGKIDKLIERAISVIENSPDVSEDILKRALKLSQEENLTDKEALILFQLGRVCIVLGEYSESIKYLNSALVIFEKTGEAESQINALNLLATNLSYIGNFTEGLKNLEQSLALAEKLNNESLTGRILNNIGSLYYAKDELDSSEKYFLMSLSLKEKINDVKGMGACYTNLALIYKDLKNIEKASEYISKAIEIKNNFRETYKDETSLAFAKNTLGSIKRLEKKYNEALKIYEEVLDIYLRQNNPLMLCETYALIAETYLAVDDVPNAVKSLNGGEQFARQVNATRINEEYDRLYKEIHGRKTI